MPEGSNTFFSTLQTEKEPPHFKTRENSKQKDCGKTVYALWKQCGQIFFSFNLL